ncbi:MAG: hypothetical protein QOF98_1631, partial [Streptomyces sp.]|nr:hypothetical protein [Streptomyces sp.]
MLDVPAETPSDDVEPPAQGTPGSPVTPPAQGLVQEIESLTEFDQVALTGSFAGYRVKAVDLRERTFALLVADTSETVFLGCPMEPQALARVRADGALVFPPVPDLPFDPYRGTLYTPGELYEGLAAA